MSKRSACLLACFLFCNPLFLFSQQACDTAHINTALSKSSALLDKGEIQSAIDTALFTWNNMANCSAPPELREKVLLQTAACYEAAREDFASKGRINQSIDMLERSIALYRQLPDNNTDLLANAYANLAGSHGLNHNEQMAVETGKKALAIRQAAQPGDPRLANNYQQVISDLMMLDDTAAMRQYLLEWESLHRRLGAKAYLQARLNLANAWAFYFDLKGDLKQAVRVIEDTLARYGEQIRAKGGFVGPSEFRLARIYADIGAFGKSLHYAEKNVALFEKRLKEQRGKLFGRSHYAWCLTYAARAAWGLYLQTKDTAWYHLADRRCTQAEEMVFIMRDRSPSDGYREWMVDSDIFGNLTEVRQGMYALTGEKRLAARSFETNEAVKTFAMQQFLHETYALQWGGIPDSLYQKEIHFRQQIIDLETNFFMVRRRSNADSLIAANDQQLFALRDQYGIFLAALEKEYPEYFRLKYKQPVIRLRDVQHEALRAGQCLLDLYIKNDKVFALLIRPDTIVWIATPFDSTAQKALENLASESRQFAEYQKLPEKEYVQRLQSFADASYLAYQVLIGPLRPMLPEEVLLIPRNELSTVPFGALLTKKETDMGKPFRWHFLDQELVISQAFSAGLFQFQQNRPKTRKPAGSVLACAPFFEGNISDDLQLPVGDVAALTRSEVFKPLPGSGEEAQAIAQLLGGQALAGQQATKHNFLNKSTDFNILHIATHSAANDVLGEYSFVALQAGSAQQKIDMLYAREIYNLRLSADLVVLSACETALGQYRNGEGIIGLTRAFTCAGARNVVASLWSVNDASTKNLMVLFYREIKKGAPYNRALTNAKRTFIRENRQYAHPYFWAGFVLNGR